MATLNKEYDHPTQQIVSVDFADIADRTGIVNFHANAGELTGGANYNLSRNPVYSESIVNTAGVSNLTIAKIGDTDYDLSTFNTSVILRGIASLNFTFSLWRINTTPQLDGYIVARIRKWNAGSTTETEIASAQSPTREMTGAGDGTLSNFMEKMDITIPRTSFKKGDQLRLTMEIWGGASSGSGTFAFGHDPQNRDSGALGSYVGINPSTDDPLTITKLEAYIPFEIDL